MSISYEQAKAFISDLDPQYQDRHHTCALLRDFWHGRYDRTKRQNQFNALFQDLVKDDGAKATTTDYNLVRNLVFDVCLKYQSFLSGLPMIRTFADSPNRRARAQAAKKERVLYGSWAHANMNQQLNRIAWFGPLMGDSFLGIWPDFEYNCVKAIVRSPEFAYPVPNFDGTELDALLFCWKTTDGRAKRAFPTYIGGDGETSKEVEVLEYSDRIQFVRWVDGKVTNRVEHNLGFNLFDQVPFIHVPGEPFNHGAVEQSVNLVIAGSALHSLMMQAVIENVFPRLILKDPLKFSETMDFGPGSTIGVNPGGDAYFLAPPTGPFSEGTAFLQENERAIKQGTSMPDVSWGQDDHSVITGKAVNALQGAGTGSVVEMVQGHGIGLALEAWNEKALTIYQRMFADDQVYLYGVQPSSYFDLNPRQFAMSFKGKEIVGSPRNEVVFGPYIDMHGKLVMALQAQGAGLTSKSWGREQIGISDSEQMQEEIVAEVLEEAVVGALVQALQADPTAANEDRTEGNVVGFLSGQPVRAGAPPPTAAAPPAGAAPAGGPQFGTLAGGGQVVAPPQPLPPGSTLSGAGAPSGAAPQTGPAGAPASAGPVTLTSAKAALSAAQIQGKAWFVGEIVATGKANGPVEVAVTNPADRQPLADTAKFPITFHIVAGKPKEQAVEITANVAQAA